MLQRADCEGGFGERVVEVPEREVDVMNGAVNADGAVAGGVFHEEAGVVEQVCCL